MQPNEPMGGAGPGMHYEQTAFHQCLLKLVQTSGDAVLLRELLQQISDVGDAGGKAVSGTADLLSDPSGMKWQEQRETVLHAAGGVMHQLERLSGGSVVKWLGPLRMKRKGEARKTLAKLVRDVTSWHESIGRDLVSLTIEMNALERHTLVLEMALAELDLYNQSFTATRDQLSAPDARELEDRLSRQSATLRTCLLTNQQTREAMHLVMRNHEATRSNLKQIMTVLPELSQIDLILSQMALQKRGAGLDRQLKEALQALEKN